MTTTLADALDPRSNALNFLRLVLASMVIFGHAAVLSGVALPGPLAIALSELPVDGFFAISGYLIARSWDRNPEWRTFLWHRGLRIFPAFWACLLLTALVIAPIATTLSGRSMDDYWTASDGPASYVFRNAALWMAQYQISGGPSAIPVPDTWDGSLWTLGWEFLCYLGIAVIGCLGIISTRRKFLPWMLLLVWLINVFGAISTATGKFAGITEHAKPMDRFALMFIAGAVLYAYQDRIPMRRDAAFISVALIGLGLVVLDDYRVLGGIALAYLMLWMGATLPVRLGMSNDISYGIYIYGFPIQQSLVMLGIAGIGWFSFAIVGLVATVPLAALSWWLIERPSLRLKNLMADKQFGQANVELSLVATDGRELAPVTADSNLRDTQNGALTVAAPLLTTAFMLGLFVVYYLLGTARA